MSWRTAKGLQPPWRICPTPLRGGVAEQWQMQLRHAAYGREGTRGMGSSDSGTDFLSVSMICRRISEFPCRWALAVTSCLYHHQITACKWSDAWPRTPKMAKAAQQGEAFVINESVFIKHCLVILSAFSVLNTVFLWFCLGCTKAEAFKGCSCVSIFI